MHTHGLPGSASCYAVRRLACSHLVYWLGSPTRLPGSASPAHARLCAVAPRRLTPGLLARLPACPPPWQRLAGSHAYPPARPREAPVAASGALPAACRSVPVAALHRRFAGRTVTSVPASGLPRRKGESVCLQAGALSAACQPVCSLPACLSVCRRRALQDGVHQRGTLCRHPPTPDGASPWGHFTPRNTDGSKV